jgi:hypothetical protein
VTTETTSTAQHASAARPVFQALPQLSEAAEAQGLERSLPEAALRPIATGGDRCSR